MSRSVPEVQRSAYSGSSPASSLVPRERQKRAAFPQGMGVEFWLVRLFITACTTALCYKLAPFGLRGLPAASVGFLLALVILLAELRLRRAEIGGLVGGAVGTVLGMFAALLVTLVVARTNEPEPSSLSSSMPRCLRLPIWDWCSVRKEAEVFLFAAIASTNHPLRIPRFA